MKPDLNLSATQDRIDQIRLAQARHQIHVNRCLAVLKRETGTERAAAAQQQLNDLNYKQDKNLEERNRLESHLRHQREQLQADQKHRDNIRRLVCAHIRSPKWKGTGKDVREAIEESRAIEDTIQALQVPS